MNSQRLFEHWCELSRDEKRKFAKLVKDHQTFARNLNLLADAINQHGAKAVELALAGDKEGARIAVIENEKAKLNIP